MPPAYNGRRRRPTIFLDRLLLAVGTTVTIRKAGFSKSAAGSGNEWTTAVCLPERIEIRASQISLHKRAF